jgi:hypothetical protein
VFFIASMIRSSALHDRAPCFKRNNCLEEATARGSTVRRGGQNERSCLFFKHRFGLVPVYPALRQSFELPPNVIAPPASLRVLRCLNTPGFFT